MRPVGGCAGLLGGPEGAIGWLLEMSLVVSVVICSMGGGSGSWASVGDAMWWQLRVARGDVGVLKFVSDGVAGIVRAGW